MKIDEFSTLRRSDEERARVTEYSAERSLQLVGELDCCASVLHTEGLARHLAESLLVSKDVRTCLRTGLATSHDNVIVSIVQV